MSKVIVAAGAGMMLVALPLFSAGPVAAAAVNAVADVNQAPLVGDISVQSPPDTQAFFRLAGRDPQGGPVTFTIDTQPAHGKLPDVLTGAFATYDPDPGFVGTDSFIYRVTDARGASATGTVTLNIQPDSPVPPAVTGPTCDGKAATIVMKPDSPVAYGTAGPDVIVGTPGDDTIYGLGGNDTICGLGGNDRIYGGVGDDRLIAGDGNNLVFGGDGNDTITAGNGSNYLFGGKGDDFIASGSGADSQFGGSGNDTLHGGSGIATLVGGDGDDHLIADVVGDSLWGGNGSDAIDAPNRHTVG